MKLSHLLILSLFISTPVFAEKTDWLAKYMRAKAFKCTMDEDQLKQQVTAHLDQNIEKLTQALKERGSDFQEIQQQRESVEIGIFPKSTEYDFYVMETVAVIMNRYSLPIQTTYLLDNATSVANGLWLPLKVNDAGNKMPCTLARISIRDGQQGSRPEVNLVIGNPSRVLIARLIEVVDVQSDPPTTAAPPPVQPASPPPAAPPSSPPPPPPVTQAPAEEKKVIEATDDDLKQAKEDKRAKARAEARAERRERRERRRRVRREEREERRQEHRHRRHRSRETDESQKTTESPEKSGECSGDLSPWKSFTCKVTGKK